MEFQELKVFREMARKERAGAIGEHLTVFTTNELVGQRRGVKIKYTALVTQSVQSQLR